MVYYKGAIAYSELQVMPIPELIELIDNAQRINRDIEAEQKRRMRK